MEKVCLFFVGKNPCITIVKYQEQAKTKKDLFEISIESEMCDRVRLGARKRSEILKLDFGFAK